ncbi:MAG: hypothetical protein LBT11_04740 [Treponema sp.]|jgi:glucosylceramidase|nr:hypothetical protein [Treponema sp.]
MQCIQISSFAADGEAIQTTREAPVTPEAAEKQQVESSVVNLYPDWEYQTIDGFGGAMTESAAWLFSRMESGTRKRALSAFFGPGGLGIKFVRVSIDSCDYSLEEYQAVEDPLADPELASFSIKRDKLYVIPMLKEAMALSTESLSVLLSPWSPPACWKTPPDMNNDMAVYGGFLGIKGPSKEPSRCYGGSLKPEYYGSWARYLVKYVQAYRDEGIPVTMLSIQNEAGAATMWDSCVWTAEEEKVFLRDHLYPALQRAALAESVGIFIWDHNKERALERALGVIDETTAGQIAGIAFHWYSGDHFEAVQMLGERFPGKVLMHSECCPLHKPGVAGMGLPFLPPSPKTAGAVDYEDAVRYAHELIGDLNAGTRRWIDWNLIVDEAGGPRHVPGGFAAGMIAQGDGSFRTNLIHHYVAHFAQYIRPGAKRIGFSRYSDAFEMTAVKNPDGALIAVLLNKGHDDAVAALRVMGQILRVSLAAHTIATIVIEP